MDVRLVGLTLHDALAMLEDTEVADAVVYVEPPEPAVQSDQDSGDEDEGGLANNLSGRQLRAPCEVVLPRSSRELRPRHQQSTAAASDEDRQLSIESEDEDQSESSEESDHPVPVKKTKLASKQPANKKTQKKQKNEVKWIKKDLPQKERFFPESDYSKFRDLTSYEAFEKFVDDEMIKFLVEQTGLYALFLNEPNPQITEDEMKSFLAIMVLSGYHALPAKRMYWDPNEDVKNELVYNAMRRDRFFKIARYLHCADNTKNDITDKMWKLRPLINVCKENFKKNYVPSETLDFDESMIEYFGRHGCKQSIRDKPTRFGYKSWSLNTPYGYLVDFEVYQGKSFKGNPKYEEKVGKCAAPMLTMIDDLPGEVKGLPMRFYVDNLFTSIPLAVELKSRGYELTGTVRENRLPKNIPIEEKKKMNCQPRGTYQFAQAKKEEIVVVKWKDNAVVTALSTVHGVQPIEKAARYSASEKKIMVNRPKLFAEYNKHMGGTDRMDQNINKYRCGIRGKKWWWPIFTYLIDACITNAWSLVRQAGSSLTQLDFRREIALVYLRRYQNPPKGLGRPAVSVSSSTDNRVSDGIRYDGRDHLLIPTDNKRRRCALETCSSRTRLECMKCDVGLCATCNVDFHIKKR